MALREGLHLSRAARCTRPGSCVSAMMVLLKLAQDVVAVGILDDWNAASGDTLFDWHVPRRIDRFGDRRFCCQGRKYLVGRAEIDVVEIKRSEHAQRCVAVWGRRFLVRSRRCLWETSTPFWSIRIERVNARQSPIVRIPARAGHLPDPHSTIELMRRVALIMLSLALMALRFHYQPFT